MSKSNHPTPSQPRVVSRSQGAIVVQLTPDQVDFLNRPLQGQGGYQSLLARLQRNMNGNLLRLTQDDCEKVVRYATQYGQGGFQERLTSIIQIAAQFDA